MVNLFNPQLFTTRLKPVLARLVLLAFCLGFAPSPAFAQCLSLGEARQAVQNGLAMPLRALRGILGGGGGEVVSVQLCRNGDRLSYSISVLGNRGEVKRFRFDAKNGTMMGH